jgi:serine/threonine-protein kinase
MGEDADGCLYLEMELLEGQTVGALMERGRLPVERAVWIAVQALDVLDAAHRSGIVHRDIKPDNLFLATDGTGERLKLLDLGIAKITAEQRMTRTGEMLGTPVYMSPEQMRAARQVDARADVYSVGAILFEMLTGQHVIQGHVYEVMAKVAQGHIERSPRERNADVPPWLDRAVARALAFDPEERFPNARETKAALEAGSSAWWQKLWPFRGKGLETADARGR